MLHVGFSGTLTTFEASSGAIRWAMPWPADYSLGGLSTYGDALISAQWDRLVSLDAATGEVRWTVPFDGSRYTAPTAHDGTVFADEGGTPAATARPPIHLKNPPAHIAPPSPNAANSKIIPRQMIIASATNNAIRVAVTSRDRVINGMSD
jgi:hypothetical protein